MSGQLTLIRSVTGPVLDGAWSVAVSPDGKHGYVASFDSDAVAVFARAKRYEPGRGWPRRGRLPGGPREPYPAFRRSPMRRETFAGAA